MKRAVGVVLGAWSLLAVLFQAWLRLTPPSPPPALERVEAERTSEALWIRDRIGKSETLASTLERNGFSSSESYAIATSLAAYFPPTRLHPEDEIEVRLSEPRAVRVHRGVLETYRATLSDGGWRSEREDVDLERRDVVLKGTLNGSLFESIESLGERPPLALAFAEILQWDFDFFTESQNGDRFGIVVEKHYRDGRFVGYGPIEAALYTPVESSPGLSAFFFEEASGGSRGHYDRKGRSLQKAFLRAPLDYERVSSRFTMARRHPILGRTMPHLGVDYAAPAGTIVRAVADGVVKTLSSGGAGGKTVTLRHGMGYESKYQHLSRFSAGLRIGNRVHQKDVIGCVGATGRATGPHLDFRLNRHGRPVNPLKEIFPPGPPLSAESLPEFETRVVRLLEKLDGASGAPYGAGR